MSTTNTIINPLLDTTKSRMVRAAFMGDNDLLFQILHELHQQTLSGDTIETEIMEYIQYATNHSNPEISAIASKFFQSKNCLVKISSVRKDFPDNVQITLKSTQNLNDVVQFLSQKFIQNVAMLKVGNGWCILPDKFDKLLGDFEDTSTTNDTNITDTISLSIIVFDAGYMEWERNCTFENLLNRCDLGIITLSPEQPSLFRQKAEALAQRTILENFDLREIINELRDENFHLTNEIYELSDKIKRQMLYINTITNNDSKLQDFKPGKLSDERLLNMIEQKISEQSTWNGGEYNVINHSIVHDDELLNHLINRYHIGINTPDSTDRWIDVDETEEHELRRKALQLAQRTIRENCELREMVADLRYRNWLLRDCIYHQQDQINHFVLLINKLERNPHANIDYKTYYNRGEKLKFEANDKSVIDWDKWHKISNKLVNGYVRQCIENEYQMNVPNGINPVIANYAVYIFCVMLL